MNYAGILEKPDKCKDCFYGWTVKEPDEWNLQSCYMLSNIELCREERRPDKLRPPPRQTENTRDGYYERLLNELADHGYFELAPCRVKTAKRCMWRLSWRVKRSPSGGWKDMKVFGSTPWDVMVQYHYWLNKEEAEQDHYENNILPDTKRGGYRNGN